jgi:hypothetical protein
MLSKLSITCSASAVSPFFRLWSGGHPCAFAPLDDMTTSKQSTNISFPVANMSRSLSFLATGYMSSAMELRRQRHCLRPRPSRPSSHTRVVAAGTETSACATPPAPIYQRVPTLNFVEVMSLLYATRTQQEVGTDAQHTLALKYDALVATLVKAVQQQQKQITY